MDNNAKKIFLSVLGVAILLVAVIGVSFAAFTYTGEGSANSISTGSITMSYSEAFAGIKLEKALPVSDADALDNDDPRSSFEFTVTSAVTGDDAITVPYTITVTPENDEGDVLTDGQVKIALFKNGTQVVQPVLISELDPSATRTGAKVLYAPEDGATNTITGDSVTDSYVMKIWVDYDVRIEEQLLTTKTYKLFVNVDSTVENLK